MKQRYIIPLVCVLLLLGCSRTKEVAPLREKVSPEIQSPLPTKERQQSVSIQQLIPEDKHPIHIQHDMPIDTRTDPVLIPQDVVVSITLDSFEPKTVTVAAGRTVTFINNANSPAWPASDIHPSHTIYPGSGIKKCGRSAIFDACKGLTKGEKFSFVFNEKGSWSYHDHLHPGMRGVVIVN